MITRTYHRTAAVKGRKVFYREAGDSCAATILLLHGLPTSSRMFRELIAALADQFHLIAPDYIGFGHSDAPSRDQFPYSFDNLAAHVGGLLDKLKLTSYVLYSRIAAARSASACLFSALIRQRASSSRTPMRIWKAWEIRPGWC